MAVGIEWRGESYGLLIDSVGEVMKLADATLEPNPVNLDPQLARVCAGVHRLDGPLMVVLDVDRLLDADEAQLQEIPGIGPEVAAAVHRFFANPRTRKVLQRLREAGVRPVAEKKPAGRQPLAGEVVVFTGALETLSRPEAQRRAEAAGARTATGVSRKVTLVVAGPGAGSKRAEAEKLGIRVIDEAEFLKRIGSR